MVKTDRLVACPNCGKPMIWDKSNEARPFCSKRCQLIDLNLWLTDQQRIPGEEGLDEQNADQEPSKD